MDLNNKLNSSTNEQNTEIHPIFKKIKNKSLIQESSSIYNNSSLSNNQDPTKGNIKNNTNDDFRYNMSLIKLLSNRTHFVIDNNSTLFHGDSKRGKTTSFIADDRDNQARNNNFYNPFKNSKKNFYLTSFKPSYKIKKMKISNSCKDMNNYNKYNVLDLIHEKEIQLCLELIKKFPDIEKNKDRNVNVRELKTKETSEIIREIKRFNFDNIKDQKTVADQILDNYNYLINYENIPLNTLSMSTNYRTNKMPMNSMYKLNISNISNNNINFNSSTISKNNSSIIKNNSSILNNNSSSNNKTLMKLKMSKSFNSKINSNLNNNDNIYNKLIYDPRNEINFNTGFIKSQKNIYEDVYSKYFKKSKINKKNEIRAKRYRQKKEEANKLTLPEIEEFKSIIKEIERQKIRENRRNKSVIFNNKNDLIVKDQLLEELNSIFKEQKNMFLNSLKCNFGDTEKAREDFRKKEINKNIQNINKIRRTPNVFVDGYSLIDGSINKKLKQYNYILGNKFHDKEQKKEKEIKFNKCVNEFENKIKYYKKKLMEEKEIYKQIFKPKIDFSKDEKN
jgi:hypothetical protein